MCVTFSAMMWKFVLPMCWSHYVMGGLSAPECWQFILQLMMLFPAAFPFLVRFSRRDQYAPEASSLGECSNIPCMLPSTASSSGNSKENIATT